MPAEPCDFELTLDVRDYECDLQGLVNNAVYQNYLEHARHQYLASLGLSFARFHEATSYSPASRSTTKPPWSAATALPSD